MVFYFTYFSILPVNDLGVRKNYRKIATKKNVKLTTRPIWTWASFVIRAEYSIQF